MKNLLTVISAALLIAAPATAQPTLAEAQAELNQAKIENCQARSVLAERMMRAHHRGMPLARVLEIANRSRVEEARRTMVRIVMEAYASPRYRTAQAQSRAQGEFRDEQLRLCYIEQGIQ